MTNYYDILEIGVETTQKDIKRAYFKKIRQYPPDKEPEKFKEIREAYEVLSNEETKKEYDERVTLPKWVQDQLKFASECRERGDLAKAIDFYSGILNKYRKLRFVEIALGEVYIENGNSQKAINLYKKLLNDEPNNVSINKLLAGAYLARGWYLKGIELYKKILKEEPEDKVNINYQITIAYLQNGKYREAKRVVLEILELDDIEKIEVYSILMYIEVNILQHSYMPTLDLFEDAKKHCLEFINCICENKQIIPDSESIIIGSILFIFQDELEEGFKQMQRIVKETGSKNIDDVFIEVKESYEYTNELEKLDGDERISEEIFRLADACQMEHSESENEELNELIILESKICICENFNGFKKEINILKNEYKKIYSKIEPIIKEIMITRNKEKLLYKYTKELETKSKNMDIDNLNPGIMEEFFSYLNSMDDDEYDDDYYEEQEPYVREQPKVGRNDKCPCGSGKKYKHCCGK